MPHRAIVDKARQPVAKTVLKSSEGWEIPCQPCRNSSINFFIGVVTSRDQQIQNMAEPDGIPGFHRERSRSIRIGGRCTLEQARLRCSRWPGILDSTEINR